MFLCRADRELFLEQLDQCLEKNEIKLYAYGQFKYSEWLGKTHSDKELAEAREREESELK